MNLQRFIVILALVVVMGLLVAYVHARIIHAGYEISRLSREREQLVERQRAVVAELAELKRPEVIEAQVRRWQLELVPGPGNGTVVVTDRRLKGRLDRR